MSQLDRILKWFDCPSIADQYSFNIGVLTVAIIVVIIVSVGFSLRFYRLLRTSKKGITIKSQRGEMQLSLSALKDFVHSSLKDIQYIKLSKVSLTGSRNSQKLQLTITAPRGKSLPMLDEEIRERIDLGLENELGLKTVKTGLIKLKRFNDKKTGPTYQYSATPESEVVEEIPPVTTIPEEELEVKDIEQNDTDKQ